MNWWEAVLTILVGSIVVHGRDPACLAPGTKFGIPYPVFARLWFGTRGAHVPALARAVIAAGGSGSTPVRRPSIDAILTRVVPFWSSLAVTFPLPAPEAFPAPLHLALAFVIFWAINVAIAMRGPSNRPARTDRRAASGPFGDRLTLVGALERAWLRPDPLAAAALHGPSFWSAFFPSVIGVIAFWATLALNIPDYTRYAKTQRGQMLGQVTSMPLTMAIFSFIGWR